MNIAMVLHDTEINKINFVSYNFFRLIPNFKNILSYKKATLQETSRKETC